MLFVLLCGAVGLDAIGGAAIFPLLAPIQSAHHLATYSLGLMSGGFYLAALLAMLVGGRLLDGRRARPVLLAGVGLGAVSMLWFGLAADLPQLVGARFLGGLCAGIILPATLKAASATADPIARGTRIGRLTAAQTGGLVLGPLAGTLLSSVGGLGLPFVVVAAALAVMWVAILAVGTPARVPAATAGSDATLSEPATPRAPLSPYPPTLDPEEAMVASGSEGIPKPARQAVVALALLAIGAQLSFGMYDALWSRLLTDRGASNFLIGLSLSLFGVPFIFLSAAGGRLAARRGPLVVTGVSLVVTAFFMASYGLLSGPIVIVVVSTVEAFVQTVSVPGAYATVAEVYPHERAATGQAHFGAAGTAAAGGAALAAAPLYAALGPAFVFCGAAVLTVGFVSAAMLVGRGRMHAPEPEAVTAPTS